MKGSVRFGFPRRQRGNTLIIAIILLLLVALSTLFAMNVGVFEQRTSANDLRQKMVQQVAEGAMSQGMAFLDLNRNVFAMQQATNAPNTAFWELCTATDTSFPCGAAAPARRATMYRFRGSTYDANGDGSTSAMEARMLPVVPRETQTGATQSGAGFNITYGAGALMCIVTQVPPGSPPSPTTCSPTINPDLADAPVLLTVVGVGSIPGENANAAVTQTIGVINRFSNLPGVPPIVASGTVDIRGGIQVVTNANSAGSGVPVSIWTRRNIDKNGTPNTCYFDEFIRYGAQNSRPPEFEGDEVQIITCDTCQCLGEHSLSYQSSGNLQLEGIDLLDADGDDGINRDVRPEEFPCDLFEYIFGVDAWRDAGTDNFCEKSIQVTYKAADGVEYTIGADEAYLYEQADYIIPTSANVDKVEAEKIVDCAFLDEEAEGIIWDQTSCGIGSNEQVSSPDHPVILVMDGGAISLQGRMFGLLFLRNNTAPADLVEATGGSVQLSMNAGAVVYGAMVMQGQMVRGNGTAAVVYNSDILNAIGNTPSNQPVLSLPGSWSDRVGFSF